MDMKGILNKGLAKYSLVFFAFYGPEAAGTNHEVQV